MSTVNENVRVRVSSPDPFEGKRGHDYLKSQWDQLYVNCRKWNRLEDKLPAVQNICQRWNP